MSSTRGSSWPKDWTRFSCTAGDSLQLSHQGNPTLDTIPHLILVIRTFVALRILFLCLEFPSVHSGFLFVWFMSIPPWNISQLFRQDLMPPENSLYLHLYHQLCYTFVLIHIVIIVLYLFFFFVFSYWPVPSSHPILCHPLLLLPPIPPASEYFPMSQLFTWGGQSTGVSALASFLPKKSQGWSPSEWTGWIS